MDGLGEAIKMLQAEAAAYPQGVQIWMRVMAISFFSGVVFIPWHRGAQWVVLVMAITALGLIVGKMLSPESSRALIGTTLHLSLWPILLVLLWRPVARKRRSESIKTTFDKVYQGWLIWVSVLIVVSLVLDATTVLI
jgi:hypothetical protein